MSEELALIEEIEQESMGEYTVFVPWIEKTIQRAINYAHQNYSPDDFPIPGNEEVL